MDIKQTLTDWSLIELLDDAGKTVELLVWGEPTNRPNGHFKLTSPVHEIVDDVLGEGCLVHTKNSIYRVEGDGMHYKFPLAAYEMLSKGFGPDAVTKFYRVQTQPKFHKSGPLKDKRIIGPMFDD